MTDTPENLRLKQQTMLNSQVRLSPASAISPAQSLLSLTGRDTALNLVASSLSGVSFLLLSVSFTQLSICLSAGDEDAARDNWIPSIKSNELFDQKLKWEHTRDKRVREDLSPESDIYKMRLRAIFLF